MRIRPVRLSSTPPKPAPTARTFPPNSASRATSGGTSPEQPVPDVRRSVGQRDLLGDRAQQLAAGIAERELLLRGADLHAEVQVVRSGHGCNSFQPRTDSLAPDNDSPMRFAPASTMLRKR